MNDKSPCYNCLDRYPGCHGSCEKYIEWRLEKIKITDARYREMLDPAKKYVIYKKIKHHERWRKQNGGLK